MSYVVPSVLTLMYSDNMIGQSYFLHLMILMVEVVIV